MAELARAIGNFDQATKNMPSQSKAWLAAALDPFHDVPLSLSGFPDMEVRKSLTTAFKSTFTIQSAAEGSAVPTGWSTVELGTSNTPLAVGSNDINIQFGSAVTADQMCATLPYDPSDPPSSTNPFDLGNLTRDAWGPAPVTLWWTDSQGQAHGYRLFPRLPDMPFRVVAAGYQVTDVTPEMYRQGMVYCSTAPLATQKHTIWTTNSQTLPVTVTDGLNPDGPAVIATTPSVTSSGTEGPQEQSTVLMLSPDAPNINDDLSRHEPSDPWASQQSVYLQSVSPLELLSAVVDTENVAELVAFLSKGNAGSFPAPYRQMLIRLPRPVTFSVTSTSNSPVPLNVDMIFLATQWAPNNSSNTGILVHSTTAFERTANLVTPTGYAPEWVSWYNSQPLVDWLQTLDSAGQIAAGTVRYDTVAAQSIGGVVAALNALSKGGTSTTLPSLKLATRTAMLDYVRKRLARAARGAQVLSIPTPAVWLASSRGSAESVLMRDTTQWPLWQGCYVIPRMNAVPQWDTPTSINDLNIASAKAGLPGRMAHRDLLVAASPDASSWSLCSGSTSAFAEATVNVVGANFVSEYQQVAPTTKLVVTVMYYCEMLPPVADPTLLTLAKPAAPYDPTIMQVYNMARATLPIATPVKNNFIGAWLALVASVVATVAGAVGAVAKAYSDAKRAAAAEWAAAQKDRGIGRNSRGLVERDFS